MNTSKNNPCNRQKAAIALGSNVDSSQGDRASHLAAAREAIGKLPGTTLLAASKDLETAPVTAHGVDPSTQGPYLNAAITIETSLAPRDLLEHLFQIECDRGRDRATEERWGPRTLDLDLLLYGDALIDEPGLGIPHPRMHERLFVLDPLAQIAGEWKVAGEDVLTVRELLADRVRSELQAEPKPQSGVTPGTE